MDFREQSSHLYHSQTPQHQLNLHQHQPYSSSYFSDPNPNSTNRIEASYPSSDAAAFNVLRPPGVDPYLPNPYAAHVGFDGAHAAPNLYSSSAAAVAAAAGCYYGGAGGGETIYQQCGVQQFTYGVMKTVGSSRTVLDLETKKQKVIQGGAPAGSVRVCSVCNVVCNSDKVFASHLAGEKHALKALGISPMGMKTKKFPGPGNAMQLTRKKATNPTPRSIAKTSIAFVQSSYCEVCKINCNSQEAFNSHKMGKKHMKNLQKLQNPIGPMPASAPVKNGDQGGTPSSTDQGKPKQNAVPAPKKDLETKKQNVLNGGAAANAVKICTLCNVVCNSQAVFNFHIAGQKHIANSNKQQATPIS